VVKERTKQNGGGKKRDSSWEKEREDKKTRSESNKRIKKGRTGKWKEVGSA